MGPAPDVHMTPVGAQRNEFLREAADGGYRDVSGGLVGSGEPTQGGAPLLLSPPPFERYTVALLWAMGLVTGVDDGDVAPLNHFERLVALVLQLMAVIVFALLVAVVTQQVTGRRPAVIEGAREGAAFSASRTIAHHRRKPSRRPAR